MVYFVVLTKLWTNLHAMKLYDASTLFELGVTLPPPADSNVSGAVSDPYLLIFNWTFLIKIL
jgi:hypothetical protein